nr:hypothetical protein [Tanacetum cinerariifolium]
MINDDVDDFGTRIEPGSHKERLENVNDDVEKTNTVVKEKDNDDGASCNMEFRNEKMQRPIPTPTRSPKKDLSSDKKIS